MSWQKLIFVFSLLNLRDDSDQVQEVQVCSHKTCGPSITARLHGAADLPPGDWGPHTPQPGGGKYMYK